MSVAELMSNPHHEDDPASPSLPGPDSQSSASNSDEPTAAAPRRWRTVFAMALVVLLIAEVAARVLGTRLDNPDWNVPELATHIDNIERITETEGNTIDTLVIGSSSPGAGFDPVELTAASDSAGQTYNGNLFGPSMGAIRLVAEDLLLELTDPDTVILGITSRALNDNSVDQARMQDSLVTSVGWRRVEGTASSFDGLNQAAGRISSLVRYRPLLRDPEQVARRLTSPSGPPVNEFGKLTSRDGLTYELNDSHAAQERSALGNWSIDGTPSNGEPSQMDELRALITTIEGQGRELIIVEMPVLTAPWWSLHPDPEQNRADYEAAIDLLIAETGVEYWDANGEETWTENDFGDPNHLNDVGAKRLSDLAANYLDNRQ